MSNILSLVREDLRQFTGYSSARSIAIEGDVWLNANEFAWANPADTQANNRRYPDPQPAALRAALANLYGCQPEQLLIGRGSDEPIDLLVRALCVPGKDTVIITPPVFGMYAVCARLQNAPLIEIPLQDSAIGFDPDFDRITSTALAKSAKLVFLCSPSNPGGNAIALAAIEKMAKALSGKAIVVVDEAYGEFSDTPSAVSLMAQHENIAVLRTLSKAHALAGARIGSVIANSELIAVLRRCQAPYPIPEPCIALALQALSPASLQQTHERVTIIKAERQRMLQALQTLPCVKHAYPSQGNFLLLRFYQPEQAFQALLHAGVVVRDQRGAPQLGDALRITIGTPAQNDQVFNILQDL